MNKKSEIFKAGMTFPWSHNHLQGSEIETQAFKAFRVHVLTTVLYNLPGREYLV